MLSILIGWIGSFMLAICAVPQAYKSYVDKHSDGISWYFLLLWLFGEVFLLIYVINKLDIPLIINYLCNIFIVVVILYYKIKGGKK
jgi:uncharacterized protein with PQ loop repeat